MCTQEFNYELGVWVKKNCGECSCNDSGISHVPGSADKDGNIYCAGCGKKM